MNEVLDLKDNYKTTTLTKVSYIQGTYHAMCESMLFTKTTLNNKEQLSVYNLQDETFIGSYDIDKVTIPSTYFDMFFVLEDDKYAMYNLIGEKVIEFEDIYSLYVYKTSGSTFTIDNVDFEVEDSIVRLAKQSIFELLDGDYSHNDYEYFLNSTSVVIAKEGKEPFVYNMPDYANDFTTNILSNGDVLVQYTYLVDKDDDYDICKGSAAYTYSILYLKMTTLRITPEGKITTVDFDYYISNIVNEITNKDEWEDYGIKVDNIVELIKIDNKRLIGQATVVMDNKLQVGDALATETTAMAVLNHQRTVVSYDGLLYLYDIDGKLIGSVNYLDKYTTKYLICGDIIYDYDLNEIASTKGYTLYNTVGQNILYTKYENNTINYYIFNGEMKKINDVNSIATDGISKNTIAFMTSDNKYAYYDENGDLLLKIDNYLNILYSGDGYQYRSFYKDGEYSFYKVVYTTIDEIAFE